MKALEITLFLLMILISIPLFTVLLPAQSGGLPTGSADLNFMNGMNLSDLQNHKPADFNQNPVMAVIDQGSFYFALALAALTWIGKIIFLIIWAYPAMVEILHVPPALAIAMQVGIWFVYVIAWYQITKGDDWSGKR